MEIIVIIIIIIITVSIEYQIIGHNRECIAKFIFFKHLHLYYYDCFQLLHQLLPHCCCSSLRTKLVLVPSAN